MIIIGYQGIGKSSIKKDDYRYIDLRSEEFYVNGKRDENWYIVYCNIATRLSKEGYIVFVSAHTKVRDILKNSGERVILCFPDLKLRDAWLSRLRIRYKQTGLEKDYRALRNAQKCYEESINSLAKEDFEKIVINEINYDLEEMLNGYLKLLKLSEVHSGENTN